MLSYLWQDSFHYRFRCMLRVKYNVNNTKMTYHDNAHTFRTVGSRTHWYFNPWIFWVPAGRRSDHTAMPTGLRRPVDAKRHDAGGTYDFAFVHRPVSTGHGPTQFAAQVKCPVWLGSPGIAGLGLEGSWNNDTAARCKTNMHSSFVL